VIAAAKHCQIPKPPRPELENVDPLTARVFHALGKTIHLNRLIMGRMIAPRGVHHGEALVLPFLSRNEGRTQRELVEIFHLSPPRVSMILRSLEKSGAVVRQADETDRRLTRVYLTPEGRRREKEQRMILGDYVSRTIGALSEADRLELERLLNELAERTMDMLREGPRTPEESDGEGTAAK
jgi:DNA-binding MarR family transcriptional regulator